MRDDEDHHEVKVNDAKQVLRVLVAAAGQVWGFPYCDETLSMRYHAHRLLDGGHNIGSEGKDENSSRIDEARGLLIEGFKGWKFEAR